MNTSFAPKITVKNSTYFKASSADSTTLSANQLIPLESSTSFDFKTLHREGSHYYVRLNQPFPNTPSGFQDPTCGYVYKDYVEVQNWPIVGVWLTHINSGEILFSETALEKALEELKDLGFNTLYPVVWTEGYTLYPSNVKAPNGCSLLYPDKTFAFPDNNMLKAIVKLGHEKGFRVIPWFESGLQVSWYGESRCRWLTEDMKKTWLVFNTDQGEDPEVLENGKKVRKNGAVPGWAWLNPFNEEVQEFIVNLITDVVTQYDVDGIQLDDHFGLGCDQLYTYITKQVNAQEVIEPVPNVKEKATERITGLLRKISEIVKPKGCMSFSPGGFWPSGSCQWAKDNCHADWENWVKNSLIEELIPQIYYDFDQPPESEMRKAFTNRLNEKPFEAAKDYIPTVIGLDVGSKEKPVRLKRIGEQVQQVQAAGFAGISLFFYGTLWTHVRPGENAEDRKTELQKILDKFKKI